MNIRELTADSPVELKHLFRDAYLRLWNHPDNLRYLSFTGIPFTKEQIDLWICALGPDNPVKYFYVKEDKNVTAILLVNDDRINGFELFSLCIAPDSKRKGLGDALVKKAVELAADNGHKSIKSLVFADNREMQRLMLKNSFIPVNIQNSKRHDGMGLVEYFRTIR
jgi:GNAT superfamily N-acetyltransferase